MRLTSFCESQIQRRITELNNNAISIEMGWDFGSGTGEQQDEFQKDFVDDSQYLEIRSLDKNNKKYKHRKHQRSQKKVGQSPWFIVQLDELSKTAREGPRPVKHKTLIEITHQQKAIDIPKEILHQQIAGETAQVFHAPGETFSINGKVRRVASSTVSIASGQIGVAVTKPINIQTAPSTQLRENPNREHKVEQKGGRTLVRSQGTSMNTYIVANQNQSEDQLR
ncbi:MAG: hypothetical protein EZS28_015891 [Streblomastix strix]|uniref:Uncharacterized protein n=1 Tax=Streblomastix strix TaxID=222440 RepID=A0A5J4W0W3_9EUKA|nr:MAG: hypothetical protein EZS28_015891 [Streblomastix strix]